MSLEKVNLRESFSDPEIKAEIKNANFKNVNQLKTLDLETAEILANSDHFCLQLNSLTQLDSEAALVLARFKGDGIYLNGLTSLTPEAATNLAQFSGQLLDLNGIKDLSDETIKALFDSNIAIIHLRALQSLSDIAVFYIISKPRLAFTFRADLQISDQAQKLLNEFLEQQKIDVEVLQNYQNFCWREIQRIL
ncbi:MAG TPA: hypothetical protein PLQ36_00350 [Candidatus Gracilibacteria bacterium]|nr:hypothetical protein [Candidatus Gracilibacteria bacterium]